MELLNIFDHINIGAVVYSIYYILPVVTVCLVVTKTCVLPLGTDITLFVNTF